MRLLATLLTLLLFACSGEDWARDDLEGTEDDPIMHFCDQPGADEPESDEQVDKGTVIVPGHGWAVRSMRTKRCFNSAGDPIFPCQWGYEPCSLNAQGLCVNDTFLGGYQEFSLNVLGRCGNESPSIAARACLRPGGRATVGGKTWTYRLVVTDCANDPLRREAWANGVRNALNRIDDTTGMTFTENPFLLPEPDLTIRCAAAAEVPLFADKAWASGFPTGQLNFAFGQPMSVNETCDIASFATLGEQRRSITDRYFTYDKGAIVFNWDKMWSGITSCPQQTQGGFYDRAIEFITMHELGHVLGFTHQRWLDPGVNVMWPQALCSEINAPPDTGFPLPMDDAAMVFDTTPQATTGLVVATGLACLKPD